MGDPLPALHTPELRRYGFGVDNMRSIKICSLCGAPCEAAKKRCPECGAGLPEETLYEAYKKRTALCRQSQDVLPADTACCPKCGKSLK